MLGTHQKVKELRAQAEKEAYEEEHRRLLSKATEEKNALSAFEKRLGMNGKE